MAATLDELFKQLKQAIADLEAQRVILGDEAVDAARFPSQQRLAELEAMVDNSTIELSTTVACQRKLVKVHYLDAVSSTVLTCLGAPKIKRLYIRWYLEAAS